LFGCDDCQTVCPFNQTGHGITTDRRYQPLERWSTTSLDDLAQGKGVGEGTPLRRAGEGIARNALIVLDNMRRR
jgi:epoxyqueuosine reductase QueG